MKSRVVIGSLATILFLRQYITINKLQFPYPYISQTKKINDDELPNKYSFRKDSWILSIKSPQLFSDKLDNLQNNDLVLCETPKGQNVFKIVGAVSRNYTRMENGVSNYVPPGFVFLIDPVRKEIGMENIAIVTSKTHLSLGKWQAWWEKPKIQEQTKLQQSFERQILERNNVREQIRQAQIFQNTSTNGNDEE